jgi:hypothetical protein
VANPHLYAVMFGGVSLGGFSVSESDRQYGRYTLVNVVECASRCMTAGRFHDGDPELVAHLMWTATHGLVTLELGGYLIEPWTADEFFEHQLVSAMVGIGDTLAAARESVSSSLARFPAEVGMHDVNPAAPR